LLKIFGRGRNGPIDTRPPLTLAVQMVSVGATFLRWLAELNASTSP